MKYSNGKVEGVKIAYIGGGSRGWAWGLMSDLADNEEMSGSVYLYDIDYVASQHNEIIGNKFNDLPQTKSKWSYHASKTAKEALTNADFVVISILPGTFDEMESDVHAPEKYGIYQSVGDSTGPGGIVRAMRTVPMFEEIGLNIKKYCPKAWVINYTNPMTLCTKTLYRVFPEIKAFGCCHEVFGAQRVFKEALESEGIENVDYTQIKVNPTGINHFTWLTSMKYQNIDVLPIYEKFIEKYQSLKEKGEIKNIDNNWMNKEFVSGQNVKFDLYKRYGVVAAAGDRHLAEFCPGKWYLKDPETVKSWGFELTTVQWRKDDLQERLQKSEDLRSGKTEVKIELTGEEGVNQMRALLGVCDLVTNINIPNVGQIPNLPKGAVVETNAVFTSDSVTPVLAGDIPQPIYPLISRICGQQEELSEAIANRDVKKIFTIFLNDPLVTCSMDDAKKLFLEMVENTKKYLTMYDFSVLK